MWSLYGLGNLADDVARKWDPDSLPGFSTDPQAAMWRDVASGFSLAASSYVAYGCDGGDPPDAPSRSQCYPLYDLIQMHKNSARESRAFAERQRQNANNIGSVTPSRSLLGDTLADLMKQDLAIAASRLRDDALSLEEFAQHHQAYVDDLEPYSC